MHRLTNLALVTIAALWGCGHEPPSGHLGAFRLIDGRVVSIRRDLDHTLRYRELDTGRSGRLYPDSDSRYVSGPGFVGRDPVALVVEMDGDGTEPVDTLRWTETGEPPMGARRIGRERWIRFTSDGVILSGRLHLPDGEGPFPGVVLVHGSGFRPGSEWLADGDFLTSSGLAVLAYDKRGTGRSGGDPTFEFHALARDVVAAADALAEQPEVRSLGIGLAAYSQGGWVAPLAATMSERIGSLLISYGMIESPAEEARLEMLALVREAAPTPAQLDEADQLIRAAVAVVADDFEGGWNRLRELDERFEGRPWRRSLKGTPVQQLTSWPRLLVEIVGPLRAPNGMPWRYNSTDVLDEIDLPMVWMLAGRDRSAPNAETVRKLAAYRESGKPFRTIVFPNAEHTMLEFEERAGRRVYTGYASDYFRTEVREALRFAKRTSP